MTSDVVTAAAAGTWQLGDRTVNRIGFGALRLPQTGPALVAGAAPGDRDKALRVLRRAVELGVNHIDTAAFYFSPLRSANELINRALAPYPDDLVIATKVGPGPRSVRCVAALGHPRAAARPGRGEPAPARPRSPRPGEPPRLPHRFDRRAFRRAGRAARRRADPPAGYLQRQARAPGPGPGHRPGGLRAEPLQHRHP